MHGLADRFGYAPPDRRLRPQVHAGLRVAARLLAIAVAIVVFGVAALVVRFRAAIADHLVPDRPEAVGHQRSALVMARLCRLLLRILNVRCTVDRETQRFFTGRDRCLILPNHVSYLDALLVNAYLPAVFVTSREIRETPGLGHLTRAAGCAFVERRNRGRVLGDLDHLTKLLNSGVNVTLFPEGTTSAGDRLLDFKSTFMEAAVRSRSRVLPVAIRYEAVDDQVFGDANRDKVAWYGDMTFLPHLVRLAATRSIDVRMHIMPEVPFRQHRSRKRLTREVKANIAARLQVDDR